MRNIIGMLHRLKLKKLAHVGSVRGVPLYVHWSVFAIAGIMLVGSIQRPAMVLVGVLSYLSVLLVHECGHMIAAQRRKYKVWSIELYPIIGFCRYEEPWSKFDRCAIAWGGVVAQAIIGVPLAAWVMIFGPTRFESFNAFLVILGLYSLCVAAFNLIPVAPLDGATAWKLIPAWFARRQESRRNRSLKYKSPR